MFSLPLLLTRFLPLLLNRYVLGVIGSLALIAGGYFAWQHWVAEPYRAQGRVEMLPTIERANAQLASDVQAFKSIETAMVEIKVKSEKLNKQIKIATSANDTRKAIEITRIQYVDRIVPVGNTDCERTADAVNRSLRK